MSLLMFSLGEAFVDVAVDTLATYVDGRPQNVVSKVGIVAHAGLVVAFTGIADVGFAWLAQVQSQMMFRDIDMLDPHVPEVLARLHAELTRDRGPLPGTSTVYHFGFSEPRQRYVGFAYRSADNFASDPLRDGFGVKPVPKMKPDSAPATVQDWIGLANQVRGEQLQLPAAERLHIGGQLVLANMQNRLITLMTVHDFPDFEEQWLTMNELLLHPPPSKG